MNPKVVLITGGALRLGREMALSLADAGYDIGLHFNHSKEAALQTKHAIEGLGRRCELLQQDLTQNGSGNNLITKTQDSLGPPTLLLNNASVFEAISFEESTEPDFNRNIDIHLKTPYFLSQHFAASCKKANIKGCIINMLDCRVTGYKIEHIPYTLTKKALMELTRLLSVALAPRIRVNGLSPGAILPEAALQDKKTAEAALTKVAQKTPMKKPGTIEDILKALHYLVDSDYVNGEILTVDGGAQYT